MTQNGSNDNTRENAIYLMGFNDAMVAMYSLRKYEIVSALKEIQTEEYKKALSTVAKIMNGGVYNPVELWEMNKYFEKLNNEIQRISNLMRAFSSGGRATDS